MIKSKLYDTSEYLFDNKVELTDVIQNIDGISENSDTYMDAYFMGKIKWNSMPSNLKLKTMSLENNILFFNKSDDPNERDHNWGYARIRKSGGLSLSNLLYINDNNELVPQIPEDDVQFINKIVMSRYATANWLRVYLRAIIIPADDVDSNGTAYNLPQSSNIYTIIQKHKDLPLISATFDGVSYDGYEKFLSGESQIDFGDIYALGEAVSLKFSRHDFEQDPDNPTCRRIISLGTGNFYFLYAQLSSFYYYDYGTFIINNYPQPLGVVPFFEYNGLDEKGKWMKVNSNLFGEETCLRIKIDSVYGAAIDRYSFDQGGFLGPYYMGDFHVINDQMYGGNDTHGEQSYWYGGNVQGKNYPGVGRNGIIRGRHITAPRNTMENTFAIYTYLYPIDIWNSIVLFHKIDTLHNDNIVVPDNTYTEDYSTSLFKNNIPKNEKVELEYEEIRNQLMNWQQPDADIIVNTYDPNQILFPTLYSLQDLTSVMKIANNYPYYEIPNTDNNFFAMIKTLKLDGQSAKDDNEIISGEDYSFSIIDIIKRTCEISQSHFDQKYIIAHFNLDNFSNERDLDGNLISPIINTSLIFEKYDEEPETVVQGDNFIYYQGETISYFSNYEE